MKINDRPAITGTIVIGLNETAELSLTQTVKAQLSFDPSQPNGATFIANGVSPHRLIIGGPLGLGEILTLELDMENGGTMHLSIAIFSVGSDPGVMRVVHYTVS